MICWAYCGGSEIREEIKGDTWLHLAADQLPWASSTSGPLNTGPPEALGPTYTRHPFPLAKVTFNYRKGLFGGGDRSRFAPRWRNTRLFISFWEPEKATFPYFILCFWLVLINPAEIPIPDKYKASHVVLPVHGCCQATQRTVLKFPSMAAPGQ